VRDSGRCYMKNGYMNEQCTLAKKGLELEEFLGSVLNLSSLVY